MGFIKATLILGIMLIAQTPQQYRIGAIEVTGVRELQKGVVESIMGLATGEPYNEADLEKGLQNFKKLYATRGYINATLTVHKDFDEQKKTVNLSIEFDEGHQYKVKSISFVGNQTITDDAIRRELTVKEGYIFNPQMWDMSIIRLNQLGYFEPIRGEDTEIKPSASGPTLDITLHVKEKARK